MGISFALRQVGCFFLAVCLLPAIVLIPIAFGIEPGEGSIGYMFILFLAYTFTAATTYNIGRGVWILVAALFYVSLMGVWVALSEILALVTGFDHEEVYGVLGFGWVLLYLAIVGYFWLTECEEDEDVVVQRGRERDHSPMYLFVSQDDPQLSEEDSVAFERDNDPESFARYQAWRQPIPEEEFDESFVYDARHPYRLPFPQDSKYRALFERRAK